MKDMSKVLMMLWDLSAEHVTDTVRTYKLVGIIQGLDQRHLPGVLAGIIQTVQDSGDDAQFKRLTREMESFADYALKEKKTADALKEIEVALDRLEQNDGIGDHKPTTPLKKKEGILSDEYLSFMANQGKGSPSVIQFQHKKAVHAADRRA